MSETELIERLERLERKSRRLRAFAFSVLVLAAALCGIYAAQPAPQKITAREVDVVDGAGNVRIRLSVNSKFGMASVKVLSADGKTVAEILATGSGASRLGSISVQDLKGNDAIISEGGLLPSGILLEGKSASVALDSNSAKERLTSEALEFFDEAGRRTVSLMSAENTGGLVFWGKQDEKFGNQSYPVQRMSLNDWGLRFSTEEGKPLIDLGGDPVSGMQSGLGLFGKSPAINLVDDQGYSLNLGSTNTITPATGETQQTSAASILMFGNGKDHHVIWRAP